MIFFAFAPLNVYDFAIFLLYFFKPYFNNYTPVELEQSLVLFPALGV